MRPIKKGSTSQSVVIRIIDSTNGTPETAVEHNTSGIDLWYRREGGLQVSITETALAAADSAWAEGGLETIGHGYYRLDPPNAAFAAGSNGVLFGGTVTGMIVIGSYYPLVNYDPYGSGGGGSPLVIGAGDVGDFKKNGIVHFFWNTIDRSGAAVAPSTAGTLRVYVDDGTSEITAPTGITDSRTFDGVTGLQECKIDLSAKSFYAIGKNYSVILVGAVVDTKTVNIKVGSFSIENRWANVRWEYAR